MKKFMKKFCAVVIALGMMVLFIPFTTYAAEGKLQFSDPKCAAGEQVEVNLRVMTEGNNVGAYEIKVKYDPKMLKFEEGDNATASKGVITLKYDGGEVPDTLHVLKFLALNNGDAKLTVEGYEAKVASGEELTLTAGESTIKVEGGTPVELDESELEDTEVSDIEVSYKDQVYYMDSDFDDSEIPEGFVKTEAEYSGQTVSAIVNEVSGQHLYLAKDADGSRIYLFDDTKTNTLRAAEMVPVTKSVNIFVMDYPEDDKMPENIKPTTMTLNNKKFMIWNNIDNQDFYYVYAFSSEGTKGYYEYDSVEQTYQRANVADFIIAEEVEEEVSPVMDMLQNNIIVILIAAAALFVILLIVIIVLSVKLHKRGKKADSDDFMDDMESFDEEITDDVNDYDENGVYDIDFDDYDDGDGNIDFEDEISVEVDDDDMDLDFENEIKLNSEKQMKKSSKKNDDDDDDFSIDFIEL